MSERIWGKGRAVVYSFLNRDPASNRVVVEAARPGPDDRILDVGCGPGAALARAARIVGPDRVAGVDPSPAMVEIARRRVAGAEVRVGGAEALPFENAAHTLVWTVSSFHHWPDQPAGLAELGRVTRQGGRVLIAERLLRRRHGHGLTPADVDQLVEALGQAGFEDVTVTRHKNGRLPLLVIQGTRVSSP